MKAFLKSDLIVLHEQFETYKETLLRQSSETALMPRSKYWYILCSTYYNVLYIIYKMFSM